MVFFVWDFRILDNQKFFPTDIWRNIWGRDLGRISGYLWYYDRGRYFRILHHQTSPEVIEGIFGKEIWCCFAPPPENLPKFDENLRFFPPIMEAIRTFVYPCKLSRFSIWKKHSGHKYKMVWSSWTWIAFNVVGRIKSEESLVKTRPNYLVLAVWQTRLRKSCLVYTMKKTTLFFEEEANLPCILANLIVDLSQTETAKWAPWVSLSLALS